MPTLNWIGKQAVASHHKAVPFRLLEADPTLAAGESDSGNIIVQGDNLLALKALLPRYAGQVKCIYIDPPYNTGNEGWVYNDNVNSPEIREWLGKVVGKEGETLDRHDRWLCMMYPRLMLLKQFLREDGAIFVSIDDNEVGHLRIIMDEIFDSSNFIANILWQKRTSPDSRLKLSDAHEHILCYAKKNALVSLNKIPQSEKQLSNYKNPDNDPRGSWASTDFSAQGFRPNQMYSITTPSGRIVTPPSGNCWKNTEDVFLKLVAENRIWFGKNGDGVPRRKTFLSESEGVTAWTWWINNEVGHSQEAKQELKDIWGELPNLFDTPKPTRLIQRILQIATNKDDLVMDSFAGSGTTAHAVLKQNAEDGGSRRFILVEMDNNIAKTVTAERVKRVCQGYTNAKGKNVEGLGSGFAFYRLSTEPLFNAAGKVRPDVTFTQLAEFVWFMETGTSLTAHTTTKLNSPLLGVFQEKAICLLYNGILKDKTEMGGNVLNARTLPFLQSLMPITTMPMVVFGARCRFDKATLSKLNITFHQLPYELAVKTWF